MQHILDIADRRPPDFIIGSPERPYIRRWWVIPRNDDFNVYLHNILRDDDDRALHDHPWDNTTLVLAGSYTEITPEGTFQRVAGDVIHRKAADSHRLVVGDGSAWSLFLTGPWLRSWGFHCPQGWVHWKDFVHPTDSGKIGKGCGE